MTGIVRGIGDAAYFLTCLEKWGAVLGFPGIIEKRILIMCGHKVMLDRHWAELYMVEAKALNWAIKRNLARFPEDFMFQLTGAERANLKCQFCTSSWGGDRGDR